MLTLYKIELYSATLTVQVKFLVLCNAFCRFIGPSFSEGLDLGFEIDTLI